MRCSRIGVLWPRASRIAPKVSTMTMRPTPHDGQSSAGGGLARPDSGVAATAGTIGVVLEVPSSRVRHSANFSRHTRLARKP